MLKLSYLFEGKKRDSAEGKADYSTRALNSSLISDFSTPASPAVSLFSSKGHKAFSSSASSLVSYTGMGNSIEGSGSLKTHLRGVREEPLERQIHEIEDDYFQHFDRLALDVYLDDAYASTLDSDGYVLTDAGQDAFHSPKKRRSNSVTSKGLSRIGSRISSMSSRWKSKRGSDELLSDTLRSRAGSASSPLSSSAMAPMSLLDSYNPPSPVMTIPGQRLSETSVLAIDIEKANHDGMDDVEPLASTPLLPPLLVDYPTNATNSPLQSPLQSPSVACVSTLPSPPLSSKPSLASMKRSRANTIRTVSGDIPPFVLGDPKDEWACKLGHANFTIQPEPYIPDVYDLDSFRAFRANWDSARCNYAKHLVRTGEHYGLTSKIYKLTEQKWESIDSEWKQNHRLIITHLDAGEGGPLSLTESNIHPCEMIKIPRLHGNDKFPELGDEEIVGPMTVMHISARAKTVRKRSFFKFLQDLVIRTSPTG